MRGRGVGTYAMKTILQTYQDKGVFVEIESAYEEGRDQAERIRRKRFYETCGMKALGVAAMVFGVKMELLGARCEMDFETYHAFYRKNYSEWAAGHILKAEILSDQ